MPSKSVTFDRIERRVPPVTSSRSGGALGGAVSACLAVFFLSAVAFANVPHERPVVINAGRGGDTTRDLLARVESEMLTHAPELVVVLAGTNDRLNSQKALPLAEYAGNLRALVRAIAARGSRLLLVTVPPVHAPYVIARHKEGFFEDEDPERRIVALNAAIRHVAREHGIPVVDFFAAVAGRGGASEAPDSLIRNLANSGSADGVHPTAEGYRVLGTLVADVIVREKLGHARRIVCMGDSITQGVHVTGEGTATGETYPAVVLGRLAGRAPPLPGP